ncbi:MAG: hypothetical protein CVV42_16495 [Candidatus Riflebacteria bacterium HGW-Riflebacteria-2]|jgi:hypothetical protein|nr:MAG: hypothetical protein CVV42_16495 [Candidatus Riflebacteria bacterium HGW-Riflebacteria-2]
MKQRLFKALFHLFIIGFCAKSQNPMMIENQARVSKIGSKVLYKDFLMGYIGGNSSNCQRLMAFSSIH